MKEGVESRRRLEKDGGGLRRINEGRRTAEG